MSKENKINQFLGKGAKKGGKFDVYMNGKTIEVENRKEAEKMLAAEKKKREGAKPESAAEPESQDEKK